MLPKGKEIAVAASCSNSAAAAAARIIPPKVISGILSRLPVKTLLRFKCVSKHWRTLVSLPEFISAHLTRSPACLLIHAFKSPIPSYEPPFDDLLNTAKEAEAKEKARLKSGKETQPQPEEEEIQLQPDGHAIYIYRLPNPHSAIDRILDFPISDESGFKNMEIVGVQNGVVCIALEPFLKKFILWNPATRSTRSLPGPSIKCSKKLYGSSSAGFGFDPAQNDYKVIRIMRHSNILIPDVAEFLNTRVGVWKRVGQHAGWPTRFWVKRQACDAVVKGVPYWRATAAFNVYLGGVAATENRGTLLWFDVRDDVFDLERCRWVEEGREMCFGEIKDFLGVALWEKGSTTDHGGIEVWVREGYNWSLKYRVGSLPNVVGFYGDRGIVQEVGSEGNLIMFELRDDSVNGQDLVSKIDDVINVQDSLPYTLKTKSYRESLTDV